MKFNQPIMRLFSAPRAWRLRGARRGAMMLLATFLLTLTAQTARADNPSWLCDGDTWNDLTKTLTLNSNATSAYKGNTEIVHLEVSSSVTNINGSAFEGCSKLKDVKFEPGGASLRFGSNVFKDCTSLESITIPSRTSDTGGYIFQGCTSLWSVTIQDGLTHIRHDAFNGCTSLKDITIPTSVTTIYKSAFNGCTSLKSITIPASVTIIDLNAFEGCI